MTRDIYEAEAQEVATVCRQFQMGKADINGDPAPLLLFQAIGINACEYLDQRGFAVIDVPSGTYDDRFHPQDSIVGALQPVVDGPGMVDVHRWSLVVGANPQGDAIAIAALLPSRRYCHQCSLAVLEQYEDSPYAFAPTPSLWIQMA